MAKKIKGILRIETGLELPSYTTTEIGNLTGMAEGFTVFNSESGRTETYSTISTVNGGVPQFHSVAVADEVADTVGGKLAIDGSDGGMTGPLVLTQAQQTLDTHAATIGQLNTAVAGAGSGHVAKTGDTMTGDLTITGGFEVLGLPATPTGATAATSQAYVDGLATNYATAAQGGTADSAVQPGDSVGTLVDVDLSTPATVNQVLSWDGTSKFVPVTLGAGVTSLDGLSDVDIATAASGNILAHDGTTFKNRALLLADVSDFDAAAYATGAEGDLAVTAVQPTDSVGVLADVTITTAADGDFLRHNGTALVNTPLVAADIPVLAYASTLQGATADSAVQPTDSVGTLVDVDLTGVVNDQILVWATDKFVVGTPAAGGADRVLKAGDTMTGELVMDNVGILMDYDVTTNDNPSNSIISFARDGVVFGTVGHDWSEDSVAIRAAGNAGVFVSSAGVGDIILEAADADIQINNHGAISLTGNTAGTAILQFSKFGNITLNGSAMTVDVPSEFTSTVLLAGDPTLALEAATRQFVLAQVNGATSALNDITDVIITGPVADGDFLRHNGTDWVDGAIIATDVPDLTATYATAAQGALAASALQNINALSIDELSDVDTTTALPSSGQVLSWDGTSKFVPVTLGAGVTSLDGLSDVTIAGAATGHVLVRDATDFKNRLLVKADIDDFVEADYAAAVHTHVKADVTDFIEAAYVHQTGDETIGGIKTFSTSVIVQGDLTVSGTTTTVDTANLAITDNIITINDGEAGATGVSLGSAGIEVDRGATIADNAQLLFVEATDKWQIGTVAAMEDIATEAYVDATSYVESFATGDWVTTGSPETFTVTAGTHGLDTTFKIYHVTVMEGTDIVDIETEINASGDVIIKTTGAVFAGMIRISL